jgi:GT2 family glycosyltransferase
MKILPASAVVPTLHRPQVFARALASLFAQGVLPAELIVVDASDDTATRVAVEAFAVQASGFCSVRWISAEIRGAAAQRNQGVAAATQTVIWFFDDDILFEPDSVARLWTAFGSAPDIGGANAMITNQRYQPPGVVSRLVFSLLGGRQDSYAGKVIGPAVSLLPEDREDLPEIVPVEWLNTTCTLYRREALPDIPFPSHFTGYSLMEDLTLSLTVGKQWKLVNARTARIYHDSQPGSHKNNPVEMEEMAIVNRHYVMTKVLGHTSAIDYAKFLLWVLFCHAAAFRTTDSRRQLISRLRGDWRGIKAILASR